MALRYGIRRERQLRVRPLNEDDEIQTSRRRGWDPRKTREENMGLAGVFDRPEEDLDWPGVAPARMAHAVAAQGRGSDSEVAHVARGEIVVPRALQNPEVLAALEKAAARHGVPLGMLTVGTAENRINPHTGAPEFGVMDWISGVFSGRVPSVNPRQPASVENADGIKSPTLESLGFDPDGPGEWGAAMRDPIGAWKANKLGEQAREEARKRYNDDQVALVNGPGDAWRHARWNQLMTRELGPERAKAFADAYEISTWDKNTAGERLMDLYNNQVGRTLPNDPHGHMNPDTVLQNVLNNGYLRRRPF